MSQGRGIRVLLCLWLMLPGLVLGQDSWSVSGFGSLGMGRLEDKNLDFLGYNADKWSFEGDSVVGLQLNLDLAERLSLTTQMVSRGYNQDDTSEFEPELDWFFLRYQLDTHWRVRVGRMRTPLYLYSETIDVGYSYVWARPPSDVYAPVAAPFANFDGADLAYISEWGDFDFDVQLLAGSMNRKRDDLSVNVDPLLGGNITLQNESFTLRYGLLMLCTDIHWGEFEAIEQLYQTAGNVLDLFASQPVSPLFREVTDGLKADNNWYSYQSLALRWSVNRFTAVGELFEFRNLDDDYANDTIGGYLSFQYRIKQFTPYVVAGYFDNQFGDNVQQALDQSYEIWPANQPAGLFQQQADQLDELRSTTAKIISNLNYSQQTWTLGVRYDVLPNVAIKAEWEYFDFIDGRGGQIVWTDPEVPDHTSLTTLILDVVF